MSLVAYGLAHELKKYKIAVNTIWPWTTIDTAAIRNLLGGIEIAKRSRKTKIVADAVILILRSKSTQMTGNNIDDE